MHSTDKEFDDRGNVYQVNAHFLEINAQAKYYFQLRNGVSLYPLFSFTANLCQLKEPLNSDNLMINSGHFFYHFSFLGFGAGIEKQVSNVWCISSSCYVQNSRNVHIWSYKGVAVLTQHCNSFDVDVFTVSGRSSARSAKSRGKRSARRAKKKTKSVSKLSVRLHFYF